ncbi:MAG: peptidase T [Clostridia bacterium]|nr:peptidase T [Clostridia bacterium]
MKNAYFAGGCFWCIGGFFEQMDGVISVTSGYSGGDEPDPSYEDVKAQKTGHRDTIRITYDENVIGYKALLDFFLANVDPFDGGGQFIDRGHSYTLAVYYTCEEDKKTAEEAVSKIKNETGKEVFIPVEPFKSFYEAENYHQHYSLTHPVEYEKELAESGRKQRGRKMDVVERFLGYVRMHTTSDENSESTPSTERQLALADQLVKELKEIGVEDAARDEKGYVYGHITATPGYEAAPAIGFIAHMDTAPDFCGENADPRIIENYDGSDIALGTSGRTLSNKDFPHLAGLKGKTIIVTDGRTLLGGDDKAGCAEIVAAAEELINSGAPHGKICIGFTPDEEIGRGADHFSVERFGAKFAYTVDGGPVNEVEYETFNAAKALFEINGFNVHPGSAKDIMINAQLVAMEIDGLLPKRETPRDTSGYEGFYHLCHMEGDVEKATLYYIIRDHDAEKFKLRKAMMESIAMTMNIKYGQGTVKVKITDQYRNMAEVIRQNFHLIENATAAIREQGLEPATEPVRGGTDGSRLSFMGLPCPNLGTGTYAMHGPYEHTCIGEMKASVKIILAIIGKYAEQK